MKKTEYSYVGIAFIILVFGIIFVPKIVDRIGEGDIERTESRSQNIMLQPKDIAPLSYLIINGERKKVMPFRFTNQAGEIISNKDFEGKVYLVEFFFTTCPTICPIMNTNLIHIQNSFTKFSDFGIASFTINPEYDTVDVLNQYAKDNGIFNNNWNLMTGDRNEIYNLCACSAIILY